MNSWNYKVCTFLFFVCLLFLRIIVVRDNHIFSCIDSLFFFFFIIEQCSVAVYLVCFQFLAIMNKAAMNMLLFHLAKLLGEESMVHKVDTHLTL